MAIYSVTLTHDTVGGTVSYEERVLYGGVDVGGFSATFAPHPGTTVKQFSRTVVKNVRTSTLLDQQVEISYGGVVLGHVFFKSTPPPAGDTVHGLETWATWDDAKNLPMDFTSDILPPA